MDIINTAIEQKFRGNSHELVDLLFNLSISVMDVAARAFSISSTQNQSLSPLRKLVSSAS